MPPNKILQVIFFHPNDEENWSGAGKIKKNEKSLTPRVHRPYKLRCKF